MNAIQVLEKARALIVNKDNWCQGTFSSHDSNKHCVVGAIESCVEEYSGERCQALTLLYITCKRLFGVGAVKVNDYMGHDAVILALDTAIGDYPEHAPKEPTAIERQASTITA